MMWSPMSSPGTGGWQAVSHRRCRTTSGGLIGAYAASAEAAYSALAAPRGLERLYEFPFGSVPGAVAARMRARDALVHGWDLANATSQSTDLDPDLAVDLLEFSRQQITAEFRGPGRRFAAEQPCDPGRPAADQLAAFLGGPSDDGPPALHPTGRTAAGHGPAPQTLPNPAFNIGPSS